MYIDLTKIIYDKMAGGQFVMAVIGNLNQELLKSLMKIAEKKLDSLATGDSIKKKLFHFMVECTQSLCKINCDKVYGENKLFLIGKQAEYYVIYVGAVFSKNQTEKVREVIDVVNKLEWSEVKSQFYNELSDKEFGSQNHLLMSLLDMSKRTKEKIQYDVKSIDSINNFLSFKTVIPGVR